MDKTPRRRFGEAQYAEWQRLYEADGLSCKQIAARFATSDSYIARRLVSRGTRLRSLSESKRRYAVNDTAFADLSDEAAYWAGFLMADGCVQPGSHALKVSLQRQDLDHLRKLAAFLGAPARPIYRLGPTCHQLTVSSRQIVSDLQAIGIIQRKSTVATLVAPGWAEHPAFWLGMLDGDGTIRLQGKTPPRVTFFGQRGLMEQCARFIAEALGRPTLAVTRHAGLWRVAPAGRVAQDLLVLLHASSPLRLQRKYLRAMQVMTWRSNQGRRGA